MLADPEAVKSLKRGLCESLGIMQKIILMLLLTACTASAIATNEAIAQKPAEQDKVACYNVITGRTFSAAECDLRVCRGTDGSARQFSGIQGHYGDGYGPCIRPREEGESNSEIDCKFGPGFLVSRGKPVQAFSSPICAEAKVEFRQCLNGTCSAAINIPIVSNSARAAMNHRWRRDVAEEPGARGRKDEPRRSMERHPRR
jgi:hypothetical protein